MPSCLSSRSSDALFQAETEGLFMLVSCCLEAADIVGERLVWDERRQALWGVDIVGKRIHCYAPQPSRHETWPTPDFPTSIGLRADCGFIVALTREVVLWTPTDGFKYLATPEPDLPDNRLNEGRVAPDGSFWVGTMQNNLTADGAPREMDRASGAVYRIDARGGCEQLTDREYGISNTMAWTGDGRFLFADTLQNTIYQ